MFALYNIYHCILLLSQSFAYYKQFKVFIAALLFILVKVTGAILSSTSVTAMSVTTLLSM